MFAPSESTVKRIGEVIETNSLGFWAESDQLHQLPQLGELVTAQSDDGAISVGVVAFGQTASIDPGRRAVRRGGSGVDDAEVYSKHPELDHVLRTTFQVLYLGYVAQDRVTYNLPPLPVRLHYSVRECPESVIQKFTEIPEYLSSLVIPRSDVDPDSLLIAHLRWVDRTLDDPEHTWLKLASKQLARLLKRDYDRLSVLLAALDPQPFGF